MKYLHKIISNLPVLTVWYWLFCALFLSGTDLYKMIFNILNTIDTIVVVCILFHFIFFHKYYNRLKITYLLCVYAIVLLNFLYFYMNEDVYYFLYYLIISTFIFLSIWNTQTHKN